MDTASIGSLPLPEAARLWLESRKDFLAKSTYRDYVVYGTCGFAKKADHRTSHSTV